MYRYKKGQIEAVYAIKPGRSYMRCSAASHMYRITRTSKVGFDELMG